MQQQYELPCASSSHPRQLCRSGIGSLLVFSEEGIHQSIQFTLHLQFHLVLTICRNLPKTSVFRSPNFRLSLSISLILLLHRILFRFLTRLRGNLANKDADPFRRRNPRIARALTSRLAPAAGASLAGFALGIYPADQLRLTIAIYFATRAAEYAYNFFENEGWFRNRPWWWGSWMMMPLATGQLLHAFVFDRDCFPKV